MKPFYPMLFVVLLSACGRSESPFQTPPAPAPQTQLASLQGTPEVLTRRLVKTVGLDLRVPDTAAASSDVQKLVGDLDGHIGNMTAERADAGFTYQMTLRIPEGRVDEAVTRIKALGQVERENVNADDVTDKFVDLSARLKNLEATEAELRALLSESRQRQQKTEDIMAIYRQLTDIRSNIEQLRGQLNVIENLAAMATIHLNLLPKISPVTAVTTWQPFATVRQSFTVLLSVLTGMVDLAIMIAIVVLPPVLILAFFVWVSLKAWQAIRARTRVRTS